MTHSACESSLVVVRSHTQGLDKELDGLVNAVLIVQTKTAHVQSVRISRVHSKNVTEWKQIINCDGKTKHAIIKDKSHHNEPKYSVLFKMDLHQHLLLSLHGNHCCDKGSLFTALHVKGNAHFSDFSTPEL